MGTSVKSRCNLGDQGERSRVAMSEARKLWLSWARHEVEERTDEAAWRREEGRRTFTKLRAVRRKWAGGGSTARVMLRISGTP
jgi:hypothetical protein